MTTTRGAIRKTAAALLLCVLLTACGAQAPKTENAPVPTASPAPQTEAPAPPDDPAYTVLNADDALHGSVPGIRRIVRPAPDDGKMIVRTDDGTLLWWGGVDFAPIRTRTQKTSA